MVTDYHVIDGHIIWTGMRLNVCDIFSMMWIFNRFFVEIIIIIIKETVTVSRSPRPIIHTRAIFKFLGLIYIYSCPSLEVWWCIFLTNSRRVRIYFAYIALMLGLSKDNVLIQEVKTSLRHKKYFFSWCRDRYNWFMAFSNWRVNWKIVL